MFPIKSSRKTVSDIKATFESKKDLTPTTPASGEQPQPHPSRKPGFLANMAPTKRPAQATKSAQQSIDAILDKAIAVLPTSSRPSGSKHPSWIGPRPQERTPTPQIAIMKHPVTIQFSSPGLQPPVFIGTSLSDPQWAPIEMDYTGNDDGEFEFFQTFTAEEGEYQYKLRLGPGDWWICDDSKPKVDDGAGNENNLVVVSPAEAMSSAAISETSESELEQLDKIDSHIVPLMPHESNSHPDHKKSNNEPPEPSTLPTSNHTGPLFRHESLAPPADEDHDDEEPESPPLLRHESVSPTSHEQEHSPLFRHESTAVENKYSEDARRLKSPLLSGHKHSNSSIPEEADPNDPSLEQFPTDHEGIMEHLDRTRRSMQEDATAHDYENLTRSPGWSAVVSASSSLPSLEEDQDGESESARQEGNVGIQNEGATAEEDIPQGRTYEPSDRPAAPMTPPLTPKDQQDEKELIDTPMSVREKAAEMKKTVKAKSAAAKGIGLSVVAVGIAFAIAAISAALAVWYIRAKSDDINI